MVCGVVNHMFSRAVLDEMKEEEVQNTELNGSGEKIYGREKVW